MFRSRCRIATALTASALMFCWCALASPRTGAPEDESAAAAIRMIRRAVSAQRDGSHLPLLFALRQLHDPDLKALFYQLAQSKDWQIQVHAVLGLGEIDPNHHIDPWLITQIDPQAQESVIATGLDLKLVATAQMTTILAEDKLSTSARLFLLTELVSLREKVDPTEVARLAGSDDNNTAGLAACLASQLGDPAPFAAYLRRIEKLEPEARASLELWLLEAVRRYKLTAMIGWVQSVLAQPGLDPEVAYRAVYSLLNLDIDAGIKAWEQQLDKEPTDRQRVRFALVLLATGASVPASAYDRLATEPSDELIGALTTLGRAISTGADQADALSRLIDLGHAKSTDWAVEHLTDVPKDQAAKVYAHMIDRLGKTATEQSDGIALAVQATTRLFEIDPDAVLSRLAAAPDDELLQQAILLGLFETNSPSAGQAAAKLRRIGSGRADSLALLLMAKHLKPLSPDDLKTLGSIAAGGGRVSPVLQVQAAWIYLKQTGQIEPSLAAVFATP